MELVPAIEPLLSPHQAAVTGGSCGANIGRVVNHLGSSDHAPTTVGGYHGWMDSSEPWVVVMMVLERREQALG